MSSPEQAWVALLKKSRCKPTCIVYWYFIVCLIPDLAHLMFKPSRKLNSIVSLWQGDITRLEVDAIVNSIHGAKHPDGYKYLALRGTVADCICKAGGKSLIEEFTELKGRNWTHEIVITKGHKLPAKRNFSLTTCISDCDENVL